MKPKLSYSADLIAHHEKDDFFIGLFAPEDKREEIYTVLAFCHEIAKTLSIVHEPMMARVRLQWWREEIDKLYQGEVFSSQPVLNSLKKFQEKIIKKSLEDVIDFYEEAFSLQGFTTVQKLRDYLVQKNKTRFALIEQVLQEKEMFNDAFCAFYGLVDFIRHTGMDISSGKHYLPIEILKKHGLDRGYITPQTESLKKVIEDLCVLAKQERQQAQSKKYFCLYQRLADIYLRQIERNGFDVFKINPEQRPALSELKIIFYAAFLKR